MTRISALSPRLIARIAAASYVVTFVAGFTSLGARGRLGRWPDIAGDVSYVVVTLLFYHLFKPVSRTLSLIASLFSFLGITLGFLAIFGLPRPELNNLVPFGVYCLLLGYLILRSKFLPHFLGVLMLFGGLGWLTFISPSLVKQLTPFNMLPGIIGEAALMLWLLIATVNERAWRDQARRQFTNQPGAGETGAALT